jgi:GT2 family glycosyltransferase/glycosyltransferase involved in cell wall biosynthesis
VIRLIKKVTYSLRVNGMKTTLEIVVIRGKIFSRKVLKVVIGSPELNEALDKVGRIEDNSYLTFESDSLDIVVCVYNNLEEIKACLNAILNNTTVDYRILLVNDGSDSDTTSFLKNFQTQHQAICRIYENEVNLGYTQSANIGLSQAKSKFVALLNSDTEVSWGWDTCLINELKSDTNLAAVGPLSNAATSQSVEGTTSPYEFASTTKPILPSVGYLNGFCMMFNHKTLLQVGHFDSQNFSPAYGEENDWAIRAIQMGYSLKVVDNAYVFHKGSVSYGDAMRQKLSAKAQANLQVKYPSSVTAAHWQMTGLNPALETARQRWTFEESRRGLINEINTYFGLRIHFVLPAGTPGGGIKVIMQEIKVLRACGVDARIVNRKDLQPLFEKYHPDHDIPIVWVDDFERMPKVALDCDVIVATLYLSTFWIKKSLSFFQLTPKLAYYVQDYEPWFFQNGSEEYTKATQSYDENLHWKFLTKTEWCSAILNEKHKITSHNLGPSYDSMNYFPGNTLSRYRNKPSVSLMVRHESPRRNPIGTIAMANKISQNFGERLDVIVFGDQNREGLLDTIDHRGILTSIEVAKLYRNTDFFLDLSDFQAMGLTTIEAMASGAIPISTSPGGVSELFNHGVSGFYFPNSNWTENIFEILSDFVKNPTDFDGISRNAIVNVTKFIPEYSVLRLVQALGD